MSVSLGGELKESLELASRTAKGKRLRESELGKGVCLGLESGEVEALVGALLASSWSVKATLAILETGILFPN
ncbi:MAG: hypothetical protein LBR92_00170 [Puniceicoccales bacterium]|nr:hypothetical protein [Puniceicoccales bacterium]